MAAITDHSDSGPPQQPPLSPSSPPTPPPPLDVFCLSPVRFCLHSFLSDSDVALLLRVSHAFSLHILSGYSFDHHVFIPRLDVSHAPERPSLIEWLRRLWYKCGGRQYNRCCGHRWRCCLRPLPPPRVRFLHTATLHSLCSRYSLRIRHMRLPVNFDGPLTDAVTGASLLPPTLRELWLGPPSDGEHWRIRPPVSVSDDTDGSFSCQYGAWEESTEPVADGIAALLNAAPSDRSCIRRLALYAVASGSFNHKLPPGCLPHGLHTLYAGPAFNHPLLPGSLPSTLTTCNLGNRFTRPIAAGVLPSRLRDLILSNRFNRALPPGVLPASLRRLSLGRRFNQPLEVGSLPSQLQWLDMGEEYNRPLPPGVIPASCTVLYMSDDFNQPLSHGSLPDGLLHLDLGYSFAQPLAPGVLPSSLLSLFCSRYDGSQLLPGVIPAHVIHLCLVYVKGRLAPGSIPPSVRHVHVLDGSQRWAEVSALVHPSTKVFARPNVILE